MKFRHVPRPRGLSPGCLAQVWIISTFVLWKGLGFWFWHAALAVPLVVGGVFVYGVVRMLYQPNVGHRIRDGLCLHCGYDLRESCDRCPECGERIESWAYTALGSRETRETRRRLDGR